MKNFVVLFAIGFTLVGCSDDSITVSGRQIEEYTKIKRCLDTGGMPIRDTWDGRLANCIYPPQKP